MLPKHHLPQLIPNRVNAAAQRLENAIWANQRPLQVEASKPSPKQVTLAEAKSLKMTKAPRASFWGKLFDQRWCRVILDEPTDDNSWLIWRDQGEATLYVNDEPHFGFNVAHRYCRLPKGATELWVQSSCIQSAIWHPEAAGMGEKGSYFEGATLAARDYEAWDAYHDMKCLVDLAMDQRVRENPLIPPLSGAGLQPVVDSYSPAYRKLLAGMDAAVDALDQKGVAAMRKCLADVYASLKADKTFARCVLTGHAHLDLVWIWPERMGELKAVNLFATADRLMDEYPEYRFAYSQPASYEVIARREPGLYQRTLKRIESGQWQATGAMYVESDTLIACGEALARSFVLGQKGFVEIIGEPSKLTWLPDVFGYSACMPQIMQQTGVDYFFTTKMTWNAINRFPHSSFIWKGNDGSEVLAHVTQDSGYVTQMEISHVKAPMNANQQAAIFDSFLLPTGYGDGGGGATDSMLERARRLGNLPGMPSIEWDQPENFFDQLSGVRDQLPTHQGECYLEYHRGTYTTHGNLKASFRGLERAMQVAESVSAVTGKTWEMETAWKRLVFAQFHDYIPGSSVWDVYLEGLPELDGHAAEQLAAAGKALAGKGTDCLFNPHAVEVRRWVDVAGQPAYVSLPPVSGKPVAEAVIESPEAVTVKGKTASNGLVEIHLNAAGWVDRLSWEGVDVPLSAPLGQLEIYADVAANFEAWDIDRHVLSLGEICRNKPTVTTVEAGVRAGFAVTRKVGQASEATVTFLLEPGSPLVDIRVDLDWQEPECLIKLLIPTEYAAANARFGSPFGSVLRPQLASGMLAEAMWELPFSRYLAVFDEGEREGMFVVTESKYGATVRDGVIGLSLVRSPKVTGYDRGHGNAWPAHLTRLKDLPTCSDMGQHSIELSIGRYDSALPRERQPAMLADTLFTAPVAYQGKALPSCLESITGGETLIPAWVKPSKQGGWLVRLHEASGQRGVAEFQFSEDVKLFKTDIIESGVGEALSGAKVRFKPYEIVTLRIEPLT
ncbi:alpha-mannosidase [Cerasicoccus maritimus]|uniref:alpha-mannosidase n=1 Tax=Cerasicoccus maritimus TaxID=490089 RepID=UPI002852C978|nr:glycoside hydrolase family 38 C-terminal domain-containing protein [Cerasicoccus maritimus]